MRLGTSPESRGVLYGAIPYGYLRTPDGKHLVAHEAEQRVIAVVRHMHVSNGWSMRRIVAELRQMGIVNRRGTSFSVRRVWAMVHAKQPAELLRRPRRKHS